MEDLLLSQKYDLPTGYIMHVREHDDGVVYASRESKISVKPEHHVDPFEVKAVATSLLEGSQKWCID